ncbi:hypothetical protein [Salinimonas lutimaris]|uniref:hypothetical protein n=1 Tax=Salinimonas lutimaris TaxID=914153 RepID=UPI0010C0DDE3|nr:hypothetical protein [Salinimonas lutimaris]
MEHPFFESITPLQDAEVNAVSGGTLLLINPLPVVPGKPPVYYTQAIGENGGALPALPVK